MLEAVRRQLFVLTDLLERQIDSSESSTARDSLRDIVSSQKRHLSALIDVVESQQREDQVKFENLVAQSQSNQAKFRSQADHLKISLDRLEPAPTENISPKILRESVGVRLVSPVSRPRSLSPALPRRQPPRHPRPAPTAQARPAGEGEDPQLWALASLQRKLAKQVSELSQSLAGESGDGVVRFN